MNQGVLQKKLTVSILKTPLLTSYIPEVSTAAVFGQDTQKATKLLLLCQKHSLL